jgi:antibiotic biosynthesis monooxygenase (ABM) superfamily enzyme
VVARRVPGASAAEPVTVTVARRVAAGRETDFEDWSDELTLAAAKFSGFLGAGRLRPSRLGEPWHVVFRFDSPGSLQAWEDSAERAALLARGEHLVEATDMHRVSGLETWFTLPGRTAPAPPKWKMFLVSATVFYLLNVLLSVLYGRALVDVPLPLRILLVSVPVTAVATWFVMPRVARWMRSWLYAAAGHSHAPRRR